MPSLIRRLSSKVYKKSKRSNLGSRDSSLVAIEESNTSSGTITRNLVADIIDTRMKQTNGIHHEEDDAIVPQGNGSTGRAEAMNGTDDVKLEDQRSCCGGLTESLSRTDEAKADVHHRMANFGVSPSPEPVIQVEDPAPYATRQDVDSTLSERGAALHALTQPHHAQSTVSVNKHQDDSPSLRQDEKSLGTKESMAVKNLVTGKATEKPQDDREMHMEALIQLVSSLPDKSANRVELTGAFLDELWGSLQHPPLSYMGDEWRYRSADGRNNSYTHPMLGAANTPYARSVNPVTIQPGALPDPGLIFDSVLAREEFIEHPNKVSSVFFNWASLIIHDLFQTSHENPGISKSSSYLDLSILYGDTQEDQDQMRTFQDGKIKPDCFSEERLLAFPPACGVMLILLNRFHNRVVENLALINEAGRFNKPAARLKGNELERAWRKHDNDLFQTGRLVTCGLYIHITLFDYVRTILNLNRTNSTWNLDPRLDKGKTPKATGQQCSAEFAVAYRWHSCIGETDEMWTEDLYKELFGKPASEVSLRELMVGLGKYDHELPKDPMERPFAHLKRGPNGKYDDDGLAEIFTQAVEQVSGSFGPRNIPKALRAITILGIEQSRAWNLCTLNEYRKFFGLKEHETFEEVNPDPYVEQQLKNLYEHPDYLELYPGFVVEDFKKPMVPGVGICPNHTISRVVLSDAVALVRGDRFYTTDWSARNLTNWGFTEVNYDLSFNQGCVFHKLLLTGLPHSYKANSIYAHQPMTIPSENEKIMKTLGRFGDYDYSEPKRAPETIRLTSYQAAKDLCSNTKTFSVAAKEGLANIVDHQTQHINLGESTQYDKAHLEPITETLPQIKRFYEYITLRLLHKNTVQIASINQVDITRDLGNLAGVYFVSDMFNLPLKTETEQSGTFTEQELWTTLATISEALFFDNESAKSMSVQMKARKLAHQLAQITEQNVKSLTVSSSEDRSTLHTYGGDMIRQLAEAGMSARDIAFSVILPAAAATASSLAKAFTEIIDYYLCDEGIKHLPEIQKLALISTPVSDARLTAYVNEALRLHGTSQIHRHAKVDATFHDGNKQIHIKAGAKIVCNPAAANRDPKIFPNSNEVKLDRDPTLYLHSDLNEYTLLGKDAFLRALAAMLRTVGTLKNLRRAPGPQGQLKKVLRPDGSTVYMREDHGSFSPFPCRMKLHFDGGIPPAVPRIITSGE